MSGVIPLVLTHALLKSKSVGTGPLSYEKRIYRAAVSQRLRNTALNGKLDPIYHLLALLGAHHILHVSVLSVNVLLAEVAGSSPLINLNYARHSAQPTGSLSISRPFLVRTHVL